MKMLKSVFLLIPVTLLLVPLGTHAQQPQQAKDWHCVRQPFVETTDGNVQFLQCVAALPKGEVLDAEDEGILTKMEIIRYNAQTLTGKDQEMMDSIWMGFGQKVGQVCQKHPNIVLAPLFPGLTSGMTTLYGCKNIIAAHKR